MNHPQNKEENKNKLGFCLEDINNGVDEEMELHKKLQNSKVYAKTLLWIANKFLNDGQRSFENKEFANFMKKLPQETTYLLNIFVTFSIIRAIKRGHFRATKYILNDGELLRKCVPLAKKTLELK